MYGNLFNAKLYTVEKFIIGHVAVWCMARPAQSPVCMRSSVHLSTLHILADHDFFVSFKNQLARETR